MTIVRPRYARIDHLTNTLLIESGISAPPVPVDQIIRARGIAIQTTSLGEISGLVIRKGKEIVIGVNKDHPPNRRRKIQTISRQRRASGQQRHRSLIETVRRRRCWS